MPNIKVGSIPPPLKNENKKRGVKVITIMIILIFLAMDLQGFVSVKANTLQRIVLYKVSVNFIDLIFVFVLSSLFFYDCIMFNV